MWGWSEMSNVGLGAVKSMVRKGWVEVKVIEAMNNEARSWKVSPTKSVNVV